MNKLFVGNEIYLRSLHWEIGLLNQMYHYFCKLNRYDQFEYSMDHFEIVIFVEAYIDKSSHYNFPLFLIQIIRFQDNYTT